MKTGASVLICLVAALTSGCFRSPATHFYSLHTLPTGIQRATSTNGPRIEIVVVAFPGYLNDPQMAVRRASGEIVVDEYNRWIEELENNFGRTVMENLVTRLDNASVVVVPPYRASESSPSLRLEVLQLDVSEEGEAVLKVRWGFSGSDAKGQTPLRLSVYREQFDGQSIEARVDALSRTVASLCDELAGAVHGRSMSEHGQPLPHRRNAHKAPSFAASSDDF